MAEASSGQLEPFFSRCWRAGWPNVVIGSIAIEAIPIEMSHFPIWGRRAQHALPARPITPRNLAHCTQCASVSTHLRNCSRKGRGQIVGRSCCAVACEPSTPLSPADCKEGHRPRDEAVPMSSPAALLPVPPALPRTHG